MTAQKTEETKNKKTNTAEKPVMNKPAETAEAAKEAVAGTFKEAAGAFKEAVGTLKEAAETVETEAKKGARKAAGKVKKKAAKKAGAANIVIQSPMGGWITPADIAKKVPDDTADVYVRVDENKLYYVRRNGECGSVDIWG